MTMRRKDVALELLAEYPCDLLMVVMGETDKAQHDFWYYLESSCSEEEREKYGEVINEHYRVADWVLGEILDTFGRDGLIAVVSDHGGGSYPHRAFRTNAWLRERGLLTVYRKADRFQNSLQTIILQAKKLLPGHLQVRLQHKSSGRLLSTLRSRYTGLHNIDWKGTLAYRVPMQSPAEGIMVNLKGRQPKGTVLPTRYEAVVEEIT